MITGWKRAYPWLYLESLSRVIPIESDSLVGSSVTANPVNSTSISVSANPGPELSDCIPQNPGDILS